MNIKDYKLKDTITAVATFPSKSALGVIKISGPKAISIISKIFVSKKSKDIKKAKTFTMHYGWIVDSNQKPATRNQKNRKAHDARRTTHDEMIDEVLVSIMKKPHSYTREDVVEISSHGGHVVLEKILETIMKNGARLAHPGEFSYRAFINGRIDLIQVQGIMDIVEAKSDKALFSSNRALSGEFSKKIAGLKDSLEESFTYLEGCINFPEDDLDIDLKAVKLNLSKASKKIENFIKDSNKGQIYREGVKCVICGRSNVGKSTLFNFFLKEERSIVTEVSGTTRDAISEVIHIKGLPLRVYDTAGFLTPKHFIDKKAIDISRKNLEEADLVICVFDYSRALNKDDLFLLNKLKESQAIFIVNKIDLKKKIDMQKLRSFKKTIVKMSILENKGLKELDKIILKNINKGAVGRSSDSVFLAKWQVQILESVKLSIDETICFIKKGYDLDFIASSLKPALERIAQLRGEEVSEEILENIFSNFCIGK